VFSGRPGKFVPPEVGKLGIVGPVGKLGVVGKEKVGGAIPPVFVAPPVTGKLSQGLVTGT